MKTIIKILFSATLTIFLTGMVQAQQITLSGGRIASENPAALAEFYISALGMIELNRSVSNGDTEVSLAFNDGAGAPNRGPVLILVQRPSDDIGETMPHHIFFTPDMNATFAAVTEAGGTLVTAQPIVIPQGDGELQVGIVRDPANNLLQFIHNQ